MFVIVLTVLSEYKTEKRNSQLEHGQPMEQTRGLFCTSDSGVARCQSQHHAVSLLANEFDVRSILHGQVRLTAVNQICVIHEAMNGFKILTIYKRIASKM